MAPLVKIYTTEGDFITNTELFHKGKDFFRKMTKKTNTREKNISNLLMKNTHKNVIDIYDIGDDYIDMELLNTNMNNVDMSKVKNAMIEVKTYLQNLGIMYIDWKLDNIGISEDGQFRLFDFNGLGLIDIKTNRWIIKPPKYWWSYKNAIQHGMTKPVDIDNYAFDREFNNKNYI
jgi:serine/threonine protein kinase